MVENEDFHKTMQPRRSISFEKLPSDVIKSNIKKINFKIKRKLGEGNFSTVKLATHSLTDENVAIKILDKTRMTSNQDKERLHRELSILKIMHHNNIVQLYTIIESQCSVYVIQEYLEGRELLEYINSKGRLSENESCRFFQQIISGLEYLHECGICHRDLKPENILLVHSKTLKLIDFGLSNFFRKGQLLGTACGSPCYVPPEMVMEKKYNGTLSDIWSAGIILYLMLVGNLPFNDEDNQILYQKILSGKYEVPYHLSADAKDLLSKIIEVNPSKRINIEGIKNHPWFNLIDKSKNMHKGIMVNSDIFPVDEEIITKMGKLGFDNPVEIRNAILRNFHNNITTVYYLLLNKKLKDGGKSVADLHSELYDEYINDPKNKISNFGNLEAVLKNKIDPGNVIDTLPKFVETTSADNNENMIVGDTGNVIERLIKSGRLVFDEENLSLNRPKKKIAFRKATELNNSEYRTVSQMNTVEDFSDNKKFNKNNHCAEKVNKIYDSPKKKSNLKKSKKNNDFDLDDYPYETITSKTAEEKKRAGSTELRRKHHHEDEEEKKTKKIKFNAKNVVIDPEEKNLMYKDGRKSNAKSTVNLKGKNKEEYSSKTSNSKLKKVGTLNNSKSAKGKFRVINTETNYDSVMEGNKGKSSRNLNDKYRKTMGNKNYMTTFDDEPAKILDFRKTEKFKKIPNENNEKGLRKNLSAVRRSRPKI